MAPAATLAYRTTETTVPTQAFASILSAMVSSAVVDVAQSVWLAGVLVKTFIRLNGC